MSLIDSFIGGILGSADFGMLLAGWMSAGPDITSAGMHRIEEYEYTPGSGLQTEAMLMAANRGGGPAGLVLNVDHQAQDLHTVDPASIEHMTQVEVFGFVEDGAMSFHDAGKFDGTRMQGNNIHPAEFDWRSGAFSLGDSGHDIMFMGWLMKGHDEWRGQAQIRTNTASWVSDQAQTRVWDFRWSLALDATMQLGAGHNSHHRFAVRGRH